MTNDDLLSTALRRHQAGAFADAEALYRKLLSRDPRHADALHLLGVLANQVGRPEVATELIGQAVEIAPAVTTYFNNLGNAFKARGNAAVAEASYRRAVQLDPQNAGAHFNLGRLLEQHGRLDEARDSYQEAVRSLPGMVEARFALGRIAGAQGDLKGAVEHCRNAVGYAPESAPAYNALGNALLEAGESLLSETCYRRAIALDPGCGDAYFNVGNVLLARKEYRPAIESFRRAIELKGDQADAYNNLGRAFAEMGEHAEAIRWFDEALVVRPDYGTVFQNRGVSLEELGDLEGAEGSYRRGLKVQPGHRDLRTNLGAVLAMQGRWEGIEYLEGIVGEEPESANAHWWLGLSLLLLGEYARGWREYEWRWRRPECTSPRRGFRQRQWRGEVLDRGATILLHAEQGLGDTLQFVRYAALVAQRGGTVILEVQPELYRLLKDLPGVSVCLKKGDALPEFQWHCPLMSLPLAFGTTLESIPASDGYVVVSDPEDSGRLVRKEDVLTVGLVWAGNPGHRRDALRSLRLRELLPLFDVGRTRFVSLQKGEAALEAGKLPFSVRVSELLIGTPRDFADTAALIAELDLVITVDTSVAHLAGAMGKPVWILLAKLPDWRWGVRGERTPWYRSARLFRQAGGGGWDGVVQEVAAELGRLAERARE